VERAHQQEAVEKTAGGQIDADRGERVDVHATHFDVLHAAFTQGAQRPLAAACDTLATNAGGVLAFSLENMRAELNPFAILVSADAFVLRPGLVNRVIEIGNV